MCERIVQLIVVTVVLFHKIFKYSYLICTSCHWKIHFYVMCLGINNHGTFLSSFRGVNSYRASHTHTQTHPYVHTHIHTCTLTRAHIHSLIPKPLPTHTRFTHIHVHARAHSRARTLCTHTCARQPTPAHVYTSIHRPPANTQPHPPPPLLATCTHACSPILHTHTHTHARARAHVHIRIYLHSQATRQHMVKRMERLPATQGSICHGAWWEVYREVIGDV